jgi:hypothetical protein
MSVPPDVKVDLLNGGRSRIGLVLLVRRHHRGSGDPSDATKRNDDLGLLVRPMLGYVGDLVAPVFRSSRDAEINCQVCRGDHDRRGDSYRLASGLLAAQRLTQIGRSVSFSWLTCEET